MLVENHSHQAVDVSIINTRYILYFTVYRMSLITNRIVCFQMQIVNELFAI